MIDPKYADLPGIAYDQPDIYETDDNPDNNLFINYINEDEDSVEKINIDAKKVFNKFKDKHISSTNVDFSDKISSKSKVGYTLCCSGDQDKTETPIEKYQRIQREIKELRNQLLEKKIDLKENTESKDLTDLIYQIEVTGRELDALNFNKTLSENAVSYLSNFQEIRFKELITQIKIMKQNQNIGSNFPVKELNLPPQESTKYGTLKYQMTYYPNKAKIQDMARLARLDIRVGYLESVIGITKNTTKCSQILKSQGIIKSLERLMANACLLNSSDLEILENKITALIHKIDNIIQRKTIILQDSKHEMIQELYGIVKQCQNCYELLPIIIDRLLSLSGLHRKAAEFGNQLKDLDNLQQTISGSLINNKILLEEIQKNFGNNLEIISNDITSINDRLQKLQNKN